MTRRPAEKPAACPNPECGGGALIQEDEVLPVAWVGCVKCEMRGPSARGSYEWDDSQWVELYARLVSAWNKLPRLAGPGDLM